MEERKLTLSDMKNLDNGSFDKMVDKAREDAKGDDELVQILLTERVLNQFFSSMINKPTNKLQESASPYTTPPPPPPPPAISTTNKGDDQGLEDMHCNNKKAPKLAKNKELKVRPLVSTTHYKQRPTSMRRGAFGHYSKKKLPNTNYGKHQSHMRKVIVPENPQLPAELKARIETMNGTEIKLVIHKPAYPTDLNTHHERLSLPRTQIISEDFLRPEEKEIVHNGGVMHVKLIGPRPYYESFKLMLKKWNSTTSWSYSLTTKYWPDFIRFYRDEKKILKEFDIVQIWSFRCNSKLHLALVKVEDDNNAGGAEGGDCVEVHMKDERAVEVHMKEEEKVVQLNI